MDLSVSGASALRCCANLSTCRPQLAPQRALAVGIDAGVMATGGLKGTETVGRRAALAFHLVTTQAQPGALVVSEPVSITDWVI